MIHFDISKLRIDLKRLEEITNSPEFWQNQEQNKIVLSNIKSIRSKIEKFNKVEYELNNLEELNMLLLEEYDNELSQELEKNTKVLEEETENLEIQTLFSGKYDRNNAILTLHPGAGGTESQDWVEMLYRMYSKWAISNGYEVKELDYLEGDEAGIKSVTFLISGENAYGYLKGEMGVHRLVRISPFDSGGRRHTSFASLEVLPEISEGIEFEINQEDLRIDTYRASRSRWATHK